MLTRNKINSILWLICGVLMLQGCVSHGRSIDHSCPQATGSQLNKNGYLMLQDGVTLECQVRNYTNRMACQEITDGEDLGLVCDNGTSSAVFVFRDGIMQTHKVYK